MVWSSRTSCSACRKSSIVAENSFVIPGPNCLCLEGELAEQLGGRKQATRSSTKVRKRSLVGYQLTRPQMTSSCIPPVFAPMFFRPMPLLQKHLLACKLLDERSRLLLLLQFLEGCQIRCRFLGLSPVPCRLVGCRSRLKRGCS